MKTQNNEIKSCGKSDCGCTSQENSTKLEEKNLEKPEEKKDPTRFGDWEVNGRAIDF
jgi:hypothetical protein